MGFDFFKILLTFISPMHKILFILIIYTTSTFAQVTWLPDSGFAENGVFTFNTCKEGHAILIQPDHKIIVGGNTDSCYLVRLHPDGTIDSSFGNNGHAVWTRYGLDQFVLTEMALKPDGKIVIVGYSEYYDEFIVQFTANGEVDTNFNNKGYQLISSNDYDNYWGFDVEILPSGKILTAGLYYSGGFFGTYTDIFFVQLNSDGTFDNTFSSDGKFTLSGLPSEHNVVRAMAIQPDGKILIGGYYMDEAFPEETDIYLEVIRLNANMTLDTSFHNTGYYRTKINGTNCRVMDVLYTEEGKIICAGYATGSNNDVSFLLQLNSDGSADYTFATEGKWISSDTTGLYFRKLALKNGNIYVTGEINNYYNNKDLVVMGFDSNGVPLVDFGVGGLMIAANSNKDDVGFDIAIQDDDKILISAGIALGNAGAAMAVLRIIPDRIDTTTATNVENTSVHIFPNPVQSQTLNLILNLTISGDVSINLLDITGKVCASVMQDLYFEKGNYNLTVQVPAELSAGQYILQLTTSEYYSTQLLVIL